MPIETFHISSESTHNKQQAGIKSISTEERGKKVMTATNMCSNFGSKWYSRQSSHFHFYLTSPPPPHPLIPLFPTYPPPHSTPLPDPSIIMYAANLVMDSATLFPSNLLIVSLSGRGSTEQDWMSGGTRLSRPTTYKHTHRTTLYHNGSMWVCSF